MDRDLLDWPHTKRPPVALEPVVCGIFDSGQRVVTLADLDAYAADTSPRSTDNTTCSLRSGLPLDGLAIISLHRTQPRPEQEILTRDSG